MLKQACVQYQMFCTYFSVFVIISSLNDSFQATMFHMKHLIILNFVGPAAAASCLVTPLLRSSVPGGANIRQIANSLFSKNMTLITLRQSLNASNSLPIQRQLHTFQEYKAE